jgi:hypothetical protein
MTIERCQITDNDGSGVVMMASFVEIKDTLIARNGNGGILCSADGLVLRNVTITENSTRNSQGGGAILVSPLASAPLAAVEMVNSIVWANSSSLNKQIVVSSLTGTAIFDARYSLLQGGFLSIDRVGNATSVTEGPGILNTFPGMDAEGRLLAGSAAIDAGDPAEERCCETDVFGNPRSLDGDLDGNIQADLGCSEFNNVHLEMTGSPQPGGTVTFSVSGTHGLEAILGYGDPSIPMCIDPFGCLSLSLEGKISLGSVPASIDISIPPDFPTPREITVQVLGGSTSAANLSNPVTLHFE